MPHLFRTSDGQMHKPGQPLSLSSADGAEMQGIWGGSAQVEKLRWWLGKPGHDLAQTDVVAAIAIRDEDTGEVRWGAAPPGARLLFVLQPPPVGKSYRIAKMVTTAAEPDQAAYFNETRFSLFAVLRGDGGFDRIPPLAAPLPNGPGGNTQPDLF
jgi:hypothetical protein